MATPSSVCTFVVVRRLLPVLVVAFTAASALGDCGDPGTGSCTAVGGTGSPACEDTDCCEAVCMDDPFCCDMEWDSACVIRAFGRPQCAPRVRNVTAGTSYTTIQAALNVAGDGHEIVLDEGGYTGINNVDLQFYGLSINLHSEGGDPAACIIDGIGMPGARGLFPSGGSVVIGGITIRNFAATDGAGILALDTDLTIRDCVIEDNHADGMNGLGGGLWMIDGTLVLENTIVRDNDATIGGGLYLQTMPLATIRGSTIGGNTALSVAGVFADSTSLVIEASRIDANVADEFGGGLFVGGPVSAAIASTVVSNNGSTYEGGGVYAAGGGTLELVNCTVVGNTGAIAGGVLVSDLTTASLVNTIAWDNSGTGVDTIHGAAATATYSLVQGGFPGVGNLDADPLFVDAPNGDYALQDGSPCVNAGDNDAPFVCPIECVLPDPDGCRDVAGASRLQECRVDVGAHESPWFDDCDDDGIADACEVTPFQGFACTTSGWLLIAPGTSHIDSADGAITVTGNNTGLPGVTFAVAETYLDGAVATVEVDVDYASIDGACPGGGSWDYPFVEVGGTFFGINDDGTLADPIDFTCTGGGTVDNANPATGVHLVIDCAALVGPGPYTLGFGVASIGNANGPGVLTFSGLRVTIDENGDGLPDDCANCPADTNGSGVVDVADLVNVILDWGTDGSGHGGDVDGSGLVDVSDLVQVILAWGACG